MELHHLGPIDSQAQVAIVTGDPDRVPALADAIGPTMNRWSRRGFVITEVDADGQAVLICSTGIGGPSVAIAVEELALLGVRHILRVGTCGSLQPQIRPGDLVISAGSIRDDGTSHHYLPPEFPAVPNPELLHAVVSEAVRTATPHHVGLTHCKDAYYVEKLEGLPLAGQWTDRWTLLRSTGVLATEMEAAALFAVAAVRRLRSAALLVPVDRTLNPARKLAALQTATRIAVGGARALTGKDPSP